MVYVDTSAIVKLYVREEYSREVSEWVRLRNESIPLTPLHELEFINTVKLKRFKKEMSGRQAESILTNFVRHEKLGVFHRPPINWAAMFSLALQLSGEHTPETGSRSLDIMHVAMALSIGASSLLTFDDGQSELASLAGLKLEKCRSRSDRPRSQNGLTETS